MEEIASRQILNQCPLSHGGHYYFRSQRPDYLGLRLDWNPRKLIRTFRVAARPPQKRLVLRLAVQFEHCPVLPFEQGPADLVGPDHIDREHPGPEPARRYRPNPRDGEHEEIAATHPRNDARLKPGVLDSGRAYPTTPDQFAPLC